MNNSRCSAPIFVVGVPRSGTTLLSAMLAAHPHLVCGPETHFFNALADVDARGLLRRADWPRSAVDFLYSIEHVGGAIPENFGLTRRELTEALARREPSIPSILSGMVELYMERQGKGRWVEKTPDHLLQLDEIRRHYPDSPIVRIIRDPRDVMASWMAVPWGPSTLLSAISHYWLHHDRSARFFEADARCHTLRYEDLVRAPESTLRELCRAVDEPFDPAMLDTSSSVRLVNAANEPWKVKAAERVDASRAEAWRDRLSGDDIRLVEAYLGDQLQANGYPMVAPEFPHYFEVHSPWVLQHHPEVAAEMVARGARSWGLPGERPALSLFLGDPNGWIGTGRWTRLADAARLARSILGHRLRGVPMAWINPQGRARVRGISSGAISRLLPRPMAGHLALQIARPGDHPSARPTVTACGGDGPRGE